MALQQRNVQDAALAEATAQYALEQQIRSDAATAFASATAEADAAHALALAAEAAANEAEQRSIAATQAALDKREAAATLTQDAADQILLADAAQTEADHYAALAQNPPNTEKTTLFVYDQQGHLIGEYDEEGEIIREYVWLGDLPLASITSASVNYIQADHLNTPVSMADQAQAVSWTATREPFGKTAVEGSSELPLRFPGQYEDPETGLHYNYFRDYDSATGRYVESDPIGLAGGLNLFSYANANSIMNTDSLGLETFMCTKPLDAMGGSGRRSGPDGPGNPLYHQYLCVYVGDGKYSCGGQDRKEGPWSPGKPSEDKYQADRCELVQEKNKCVEKCLLTKFGEQRPYYGLFGPGTNCQEWASDALNACGKQCEKKK